jgi:hypothetical protein
MPTAAAPRRQAVHAGFDTERLEPRVLLDATLGLDSTDLLVRPSGRNASPLVLVPTDEVPQEIEIVNRSTRSVASGVLSVQFLLSRDRILGDDVLVADAVRTVLLRPGESTFVELELNPPADIARGEYFLIALARPTEGSSIIDPELGNNTRVLPGVRTVVWQFGRVGTRQNISLSIDLGDNKGATFFINAWSFSSRTPTSPRASSPGPSPSTRPGATSCRRRRSTSGASSPTRPLSGSNSATSTSDSP